MSAGGGGAGGTVRLRNLRLGCVIHGGACPDSGLNWLGVAVVVVAGVVLAVRDGGFARGGRALAHCWRVALRMGAVVPCSMVHGWVCLSRPWRETKVFSLISRNTRD